MRITKIEREYNLSATLRNSVLHLEPTPVVSSIEKVSTICSKSGV
jgi:hypothetical protein